MMLLKVVVGYSAQLEAAVEGRIERSQLCGVNADQRARLQNVNVTITAVQMHGNRKITN